jgi:steroid delta-isomerase-like uncharacterized protein
MIFCAHFNLVILVQSSFSEGENFMRRTAAFALVLLAAALSLPHQARSGNPPAPSSAAESWIAAWNSHDPAKWATHFTSDIYYEDVTFGEISHGSEEGKKFAAGFFEAVPDLKLELTDSFIQGNHGSVEWILTGTDKGVYKTGKPFKVRGVSIITIKSGKISRSLDYYDSATILKQVGLLPAS